MQAAFGLRLSEVKELGIRVEARVRLSAKVRVRCRVNCLSSY